MIPSAVVPPRPRHFRATLYDLVVERHADVPAHRHDHRLAPVRPYLRPHRLAPPVEVQEQIVRDRLQTRPRADELGQLRPLALGLLAALQLLVLDDLLHLRVQPLDLGGVQVQLRPPALVVDLHRRPVLHGVGDVVHAHVLPEHAPRVPVLQCDRRPREPDERRVRQRVPQVLGVPVDVPARLLVERRPDAVLAAVRLVADDDDVAPPAQHRVRRLALQRRELLHRRKDDPARRPPVENVAQLLPAVRLLRGFAQQRPRRRELPEQLPVEVVAIRHDHQRRVVHPPLLEQLPGVHRHRDALARPLRVPEHARLPLVPRRGSASAPPPPARRGTGGSRRSS